MNVIGTIIIIKNIMFILQSLHILHKYNTISTFEARFH